MRELQVRHGKKRQFTGWRTRNLSKINGVVYWPETHITLRHSTRTRKRNVAYYWVRRIRNMTKVVIIAFAAVALVQPALSVAENKSIDSGAKPNSFVPHSHTSHHVYGSPIQPPILGHAKTSHKHAPKK